MTRRELLLAGLAVPPLTARTPPNVLVFMSDQESALLPGPVSLPNRRKLEHNALRFTNAFCNTPQCSPARSSLLTGLEPHETHVLTNVDKGSLGKPLPPSTPTVGSVFSGSGYSTGYFGKWHLGDEAGGPGHFGFSYRAAGTDDEAARSAADWIRRQRDPWLAWVSVLNPHRIYELPRIIRDVKPRPGVQPPFSTVDNLAGKPAEQQQYSSDDQGRPARKYSPEDWIRYRSYYCELVEKVDRNLGTVLDAIPGLSSTIVLYTSDHGDALGEHGLPFKGPFMYEELIRIPLLVSAPGQRPGARSDFTTQTAVAPMLASLAGLRWPASQTQRTRDTVFLEYYGKQKWVAPIRTVRTARWKLNVYDRTGHRELYDLHSDPHETTNRAGARDATAIESGLQSKLDAWRAPEAE